ncbi:MAG: serine hydrolase domain-containing protein [Reyranellaceae bacterium]
MDSRALRAALDYVPQYLDFQMRSSQQPGCSVAIAHKGKVVFERAYGFANAVTGRELTPRHRFRVASHSKSFTAAGILKLREAGKVKLDDRAGEYVEGLHGEVARATIAQLLSHSAGIIRDGADSGQWADRRPFLDADELRAALAVKPVLQTSARFKYSNHGYGLIGLIIEAVAGQDYNKWIAQNVVGPAGLMETTPDMPLPRGAKLATGHSGRLPLGRRVAIPGRNPTYALASATGFVSTAADLARFYAQLDPAAKKSFLSAESRREMVRRQWRDPHSSLERYYGLGTISGATAGWDHVGHSGGFQGFITRSGALPGHELSLSVLTNAADGLSHFWFDGIVNILATFAKNGAAKGAAKSWAGRWWSLWGCTDLVPMGEKVMVALPGLFNPFMDASEIKPTKRDAGVIALAGGYASHGENVRRVRNAAGRVTELWMSGNKLLSETRVAGEMQKRYEAEKAKRRTKRR